MIRTQQPRAPWAWVFWMSLPIGVFAFVEKCSGSALTFTLRKFIADPALISLLGSVNIAFNILVAPVVAWKSDRLQTRWGRRKPFIVAGLAMLVPALIAMPLASSLWTLVPATLLYQFAVDFGFTGPWRPLYYEIIPKAQRGRAASVNRLMSVTARLSFNFLLIGRFDEAGAVKLNAGFAGVNSWSLTGEQLIYFLAAALVAASLVFVVLFVREEPPPEGGPAPSSIPSPWPGRVFLQTVFGSEHARWLCLLVAASAATQVGLGQLQSLLITEQFGYTKSALGNMHGITILLEIGIVLPVMAWLLDRCDRFRVFQAGLLLATIQPLAYWLYVKFAASNQIPSIPAIIAFTAAGAVAKTAAFLSLEPMLFDLTPRHLMGTFNSGFVMARGLAAVLLMNGTGLWVKYYSSVFSPPLKIDYMSGYLYLFACGAASCVLALAAAPRLREMPRPETSEP